MFFESGLYRQDSRSRLGRQAARIGDYRRRRRMIRRCTAGESLCGGVCLVAHKPVTLARHGDDNGLPAIGFSQRLPQKENHLGEVAFLHEGIGPHLLHQLVFENCLSRFLKKSIKDIESLYGKRNQLAVPCKTLAPPVSPEWPELIEVFCFHRLRGPLRDLERN